VAKNLLILFPLIERIITPSSTHQTYLSELEKLIVSFRKVIVAYLRRREFEERTTKGRGIASEAVERLKEAPRSGPL
jgi:hypothetical protein